MSNYTEIAIDLINSNANVNIQDNNGATALITGFKILIFFF